MKLDKFSPLGSLKIEESEISPLTATLALGSQGRNADGQGGGGVTTSSLRKTPFSYCFACAALSD